LSLRSKECATVDIQDGIIEGTAREVIAELVRVPADQPVRAIVGHPSLSLIARRLQGTAAANDMTEEVHDDLMRSLKTGA
jgi:hypothetical protein